MPISLREHDSFSSFLQQQVSTYGTQFSACIWHFDEWNVQWRVKINVWKVKRIVWTDPRNQNHTEMKDQTRGMYNVNYVHVVYALSIRPTVLLNNYPRIPGCPSIHLRCCSSHSRVQQTSENFKDFFLLEFSVGGGGGGGFVSNLFSSISLLSSLSPSCGPRIPTSQRGFLSGVRP